MFNLNLMKKLCIIKINFKNEYTKTSPYKEGEKTILIFL